jgi:hypothetical protein
MRQMEVGGKRTLRLGECIHGAAPVVALKVLLSKPGIRWD